MRRYFRNGSNFPYLYPGIRHVKIKQGAAYSSFSSKTSVPGLSGAQGVFEMRRYMLSHLDPNDEEELRHIAALKMIRQ
jgi:hypothetical protein